MFLVETILLLQPERTHLVISVAWEEETGAFVLHVYDEAFYTGNRIAVVAEVLWRKALGLDSMWGMGSCVTGVGEIKILMAILWLINLRLVCHWSLDGKVNGSLLLWLLRFLFILMIMTLCDNQSVCSYIKEYTVYISWAERWRQERKEEKCDWGTRTHHQ